MSRASQSPTTLIASMASRRSIPSSSNSGKLLAIAPREEQASPTSETGSPQIPVADIPKSKLPPRSRNGCWTCRTRKVKCDEARPGCNQCTRLGHFCDYSPKLSFKDETSKIVHKYLGPASPGAKWNPTVEASTSGQSYFTHAADTLPPFTSLSNEDDWQRKAENKPPGTYFVVANSSSFSEVEEYRQARSSRTESSRRFGEKSQSPKPNISVGSATLILGSFEDISKKPSLGSPNAAERYTSPPRTPSGVNTTSVAQTLNRLQVSPQETSGSRMSHEGGINRVKMHYRTVVRLHILQMSEISPSTLSGLEDTFEQVAEGFPPLHHAIMALSALSLFHRNRGPKVDTFQHYQQALLPLQSLRREEDLASDGALLTHFMLLLYEVAGTDSQDQFWAQHMSSLSRIVQIRRRLLKNEPYPYVIWWICLMDLNALLSGSGRGDFVGPLIRNDTVPTETEMREAAAFLGPGQLFGGQERELFSAAWQFQRDIVLVAANIGLLSQHLRDIVSQQQEMPNSATLAHWQQEASNYRETIRQRWHTMMRPNLERYLAEHTLSGGLMSIMDSTRLIFNMCIIYTFAMMWPRQRQHTGPVQDPAFDEATSEIIEMASSRIANGNFELRSLALPLLLAGIFADSATEKMRAQDLLQALENESIGSNTQLTRLLLGKVYERQNHGLMTVGQRLDVDYVEVMRQMGQEIVHAGL